VPVWKELAERYSPMGFNFTIVYILEAHAQDEWPISSSRYHPNGQRVLLNQHKSMDDRVAAAVAFRDTFKLQGHRILIDDMDNTFNGAYAAWPFRYYVVDEDKVRLLGLPDVNDYGDVFSSKPLHDFLSFYDFGYNKEDAKRRGSSRAASVARMLHYSSGRRGYDDASK